MNHKAGINDHIWHSFVVVLINDVLIAVLLATENSPSFPRYIPILQIYPSRKHAQMRPDVCLVLSCNRLFDARLESFLVTWIGEFFVAPLRQWHFLVISLIEHESHRLLPFPILRRSRRIK